MSDIPKGAVRPEPDQGYVCVSDIVEPNGKTIRENNMEQQHNIPIGELVEVKYTEWHNDGACEAICARLWVVAHTRDCDGSPLYSLSPKHPDKAKDRVMLYYPDSDWPGVELPGGLPGVMFREDISGRIVDGVKTGFAEKSLKVIPVTNRLRKGYGALSWDDDGTLNTDIPQDDRDDEDTSA